MHRAKLTRIGNALGLTIPRELLTEASLTRGDDIAITVRDGRIEIVKADTRYNRAMELGRAFAGRYRRAIAALAK